MPAIRLFIASAIRQNTYKSPTRNILSHPNLESVINPTLRAITLMTDSSNRWGSDSSSAVGRLPSVEFDISEVSIPTYIDTMNKHRRNRVEREETHVGENPTENSAAEVKDHGLSLEQLSETYAALLGSGDDPFEKAPDSRQKPIDDDSVAAEVEELLKEHDERIDDQFCEISPKSILEAMLFVGHPENQPLTAEQVAEFMRGVRANEIPDLVRELNDEYATQSLPVRIESEAGGFRLGLADGYESVRNKFYGQIRQARLSQQAVDVLAIVAYHQPVTREQVDTIRSESSSGPLLRQLVRRNLVKMERPTEKPRTPQYSTTSRFLKFFGLDTIEDLPRSHDLDHA